MEWTLDLSLKSQFVSVTQTAFRDHPLHEIQRRFYEWGSLASLTIITAPTGTGKSYAFPLPIIRKKEKGGLSDLRGMIIAPTNALIDDMYENYNRNFGDDLNIKKLNRQSLDKLDVHGPDRWQGVLQIISESNLVITNPDLLNFAIFGGYHRYKGQQQFPELLAKIDYFVFDEYHLYDEEQIANIISYIMLQKELIGGKETKFIFASATPEKGLSLLFQEQGWGFEEIVESVIETPVDDCRMIHGEIDVSFRKASSLLDLVYEISNELHAAIKRNERILLIFDSLRDLQNAKTDLRKLFHEFYIAEESGYQTKASCKDDIENAQIILGTNKIEQGVNLNVNFCVMQPGKNYASFIQRFGRVARGNQNGKIFVVVDKIQELKRIFDGYSSIGYYEFTEKMKNILQERNFYTERVPYFLGASLFAIQNGADFNLKRILAEHLKLAGSVKFIWDIMTYIDIAIKNELRKANEATGCGYFSNYKAWNEWWAEFLSTFQYFRGDSQNVTVRDIDYEEDKKIPFWQTEYRYDWLILNKNILEKAVDKEGNVYFVVSGFKDEKPELQYFIPTLPIGGVDQSTNYLLQKDKYELKRAFEKRVSQICSLYTNRTPDEFSRKAIEILKNIIKLKPIFTEKRLKIKDILEHSNII